VSAGNADTGVAASPAVAAAAAPPVPDLLSRLAIIVSASPSPGRRKAAEVERYIRAVSAADVKTYVIAVSKAGAAIVADDTRISPYIAVRL
jgi:hypothetical protein